MESPRIVRVDTGDGDGDANGLRVGYGWSGHMGLLNISFLGGFAPNLLFTSQC